MHVSDRVRIVISYSHHRYSDAAFRRSHSIDTNPNAQSQNVWELQGALLTFAPQRFALAGKWKYENSLFGKSIHHFGASR